MMFLFTRTRQKRLVLSTILIEEVLTGENLTFLSQREKLPLAELVGISGSES